MQLDQHTIILVLAILILSVAIWMVMCKAEPFEQLFPFASTLTPEQVADKLADNTCAAAVSNLCAEAKGQNLFIPSKDLSGPLSAVQSACGSDFPPYSVCAAQDPQFGINTPLIRGGTHKNQP